MFQASYTLNIHIVQVIAIWSFSEVCKKGSQLCRENPEFNIITIEKLLKFVKLLGKKLTTFSGIQKTV